MEFQKILTSDSEPYCYSTYQQMIGTFFKNLIPAEIVFYYKTLNYVWELRIDFYFL